jgi:catechol 2,3-dioxygenase-like lactoylglutathione lyase family enzyme
LFALGLPCCRLGDRSQSATESTLLFVCEPSRSAPSTEALLAVADLPRAAAFYQRLGFERAHGGNLGGFLGLAFGSARIHLRERPGLGARRGSRVWLVCDDFDRQYQRTRARVSTPPPEVAFHGDIVLNLRDPDGHPVTFSAPTDI